MEHKALGEWVLSNRKFGKITVICQTLPSPWKLKEAFRQSWIVSHVFLTPYPEPPSFHLPVLRASHWAGRSETWLYFTSRRLFWHRLGEREQPRAGCKCRVLTPECTRFWVWAFADSKAVSKVGCCGGISLEMLSVQSESRTGSPTWRMNASFSCFVDSPPTGHFLWSSPICS